jgi:hypothetical protein
MSGEVVKAVRAMLPEDTYGRGNLRLVHVKSVRNVMELLSGRIEKLEEQVAVLKAQLPSGSGG